MKPANPVFVQRSIEKKLGEKYQDKTLCSQYAWWLLEALTKKTKEELIANSKLNLTEEQLELLDDWMDKLFNKSMPLQYLLGTVPFLDLEIFVTPPILIPRPETEELCANLVEQLQQLDDQELNILDIGTGSGCIAIALARALPKATVHATDISDAAITLARRNADHNIISNIVFFKSDVFASLEKSFRYNLIISNPPYIAPKEWDDLDDSVTQWEDRDALIAQNNGLAIIERIVKQAPNFLKEHNEMELYNIPQLVLEIGYKQGTSVASLLENAGFGAITIKKDLEGKDRVVTGRVKNVAVQTKNK